MVFSSLNFLFIFLALVMAAHLAVPARLRNIVLLIASLIFYAWGEPVYILLMLLSVGFNYVTGLQIGLRAGKPRAARAALIAGVAVDLATLGFFKYYGFVVDLLSSITGLALVRRELPLPIGISFYTFQALSYIIDVYRGKVKPQRSLIDFSVYITMFPQLVAGPIVVYADIESQLKKRTVSLQRIGLGVERLTLGLVKKVLLANNLGQLYAAIQQSAQRSMLTAWLGAAAYALQLYFDFSGYSDMAIGMGRWHISLSGWFRDYVYIPLGGNRVSKGRHIVNLLIVWALTGLWHGASLNFVLWGMYYGVLLVIEKYLTGDALGRLPGAASRTITLILVGIGWIIFSNTDFGAMRAYLGSMFGIGASGFADGAFLYYLRTNLILLAVGVMCCAPAMREMIVDLSRRAPIVGAVVIGVIFVVSVAYLVYGSYNPFLYFRF